MHQHDAIALELMDTASQKLLAFDPTVGSQALAEEEFGPAYASKVLTYSKVCISKAEDPMCIWWEHSSKRASTRLCISFSIVETFNAS